MSGEGPRERLHRVIFGTDTRLGRTFDILLLVAILASVTLVVFASLPQLGGPYGDLFRAAEWTFTALFTVEYLLRVYAARDRRGYIFSFFGIVDLMAVLPTYLGLFVTGAEYALVIRSIRLLRIFRVLKLVRFLDDADLLMRALRASREKILVFLFAVATIVLIAGTAMYLVEGPRPGFDNVPVSIYWAVVSLTTVGYGDIVPVTAVGRFLSAVLMITGYAIIAVPTGIVTTEIGSATRSRARAGLECPRCRATDHGLGSNYCYNCGERLPTGETGEPFDGSFGGAQDTGPGDQATRRKSSE